MAKIFWVEDQTHWIEKFQPILQSADFDGKANELSIARYSEAARQQIALRNEKDRPDIAILDAKMNGNDQAGFSVTAALEKKWPGLPIIFLSEHAGTELERDALVEYQVLDFVSKHQQNIEEVLVWRIKAALRNAAVQSQGTVNTKDVLVSGDLRIDLTTWDVFWKGVRLMNPDNASRPLAPTPRKILRCLVERSPRPVTPAQMAEAVGIDPDGFADVTFRQHIKTLRRSFDKADGGEQRFSNACKQGQGIVAFGEEGAYCWKPLAK